MEQNSSPVVGPQPVPPIRKVMMPVIVFAIAWALLIGLNASERPAFTPLTGDSFGVALSLDDQTPPYSTALADGFVPAAEDPRAQVLKGLGEFRAAWQQEQPRITVTPMNQGIGTASFAAQLDQWFTQFSIGAGASSGIAQVALPGVGDGFVIRCRKSDRALAQDLALALAPVLRGDITILYSEQAEARKLDIFLEAAPRFSAIGVAYFGVADPGA